MDREKAVRVETCLIEADSALHQAGLIVAGLAKEDRVKFGDLLEGVLDALHSGLLAALYSQHPDMDPSSDDAEIPEINSEMQWDQVRLPPSISETDIDAVIFSLLKPRWQKVALIVGDALGRCRQLGLPISDGALAARIRLLVETDRIEGIGDLRMWRHSEVRLKS